MITRVRIFYCLLLVCLVRPAKAQQLDKSSSYIGFMVGQATGKYRSVLSRYQLNQSAFGLAGGYLRNIRKDVTSPVFLGGEAGWYALGTTAVPSAIGGTYTATNSQWWLQALARYRPIVTASVLNPYLDFLAGAKGMGSGVYYQVNEEESERVDGFSRPSFVMGIGAGLGIKLPFFEGASPYLDIALHYQQTPAVNQWVRGTAQINRQGNVEVIKQAFPTSNWQLRFMFTRFR